MKQIRLKLYLAWLSLVTWSDRARGRVCVMEDKTIVLFDGMIPIELRRLTKDHTITRYREELSDKFTKTVHVAKIMEIIPNTYRWNKQLRDLFNNCQLILRKEDSTLVAYNYCIEKGFYPTDEESWHISQRLHEKARSPKAWKNEFYFAYNL